MRLGGVSPGDIVLADVKGRRFHAIVIARHDRELVVEPIDRRVAYRRVKARQVLGIWRKSRGRRARARSEFATRNGSTSGVVAGRSEAT